MMRRTLFAMAATLPLATGVASAALTPAQNCVIAKDNAIKAKYACLTRQSNIAVQGGTPNTAACETAFLKAFANAEAAAVRAGGTCPVTGDARRIERRVDAEEAGTEQLVVGEGRFHDNGDGTIIDAKTGLMWEKKSSDGSLHDQGKTYTWSTSGTAADGTLFTTFLVGLNASGGFAAHTDWRIPSSSELDTIVDYTTSFPSVSAAFNSGCVASCTVTSCSCTNASVVYWSSTPVAGFPLSAWDVNFRFGLVGNLNKSGTLSARGVRAGS